MCNFRIAVIRAQLEILEEISFQGGEYVRFGGAGMEREYRSLCYVLPILLPIFLAGFWIPYLSEIPHFDVSITTAVHVHAILLFSFLILLIVQPLAIRYGAFSIHRILGRLSNVLMPFIFVFSVSMLWKEYHEHLRDGMAAPMARNAEFLSTAQLILFVTLYGFALFSIRRHDVSTHMRCMICIALVLLPAGLSRTLGYWFNFRQSVSQTVCFALIDITLLGLIVFDRRLRLTGRPYLSALLAYVVIESIWISLGRPV